MTIRVAVTVNGTEYARDVEPRLLLIHFIRDELGLTGSHWGCDTSNCGSCVVWLDAKPVKSCTLLAAMADGRTLRTVRPSAIGVSTVHDFTGLPLSQTMQVPQFDVSQPQWLPVRPSSSRRKWMSSSRGSTSLVYSVPLSVTVTRIGQLPYAARA